MVRVHSLTPVALVTVLLATPALADVTISLPNDSPALAFGAAELLAALGEARTPAAVRVSGTGEITVRLDPAAVGGAAEAFAIRRAAQRIEIVGDEIGAMYGLLDLADSVALGGLKAVKPKRVQPFLAMRGLKWNLPLSGGAYAGEQGGRPGEWLWSKDFWEKHLSMMARNRYNTLTLWNGCPYHHLVHLDNVPGATDLPRERIDANMAFFRWVTRRARELGISTYLITWNIHVPPSFAKAHGIGDAGVDTPEVREYLREAVWALIDTYPDLTGIGTCPGEQMPMGAQQKQDWIADVYFEGLKRASREVPFLLRYWQGDPEAMARMLDRVKWPEPVYVSVKYNGEHMCSSPMFHVLDHRWLTMADRRWQVIWHLRNDCLFRLKWGDPRFVRETIRNCRADYSGGFFWGSEYLKPGADPSYQPTSDAFAKYDYEFERKSEMYALWGRLGYDPTTSDQVLTLDFRRRFGAAADDAFHALAQASRAIPLTTSFHWNYMNGDWQPEYNTGSWNTSYEQSIANYRDKETFHSVKEFIFNATIDATLCSIPDYTTAQMTGRSLPRGQASPPQAAQAILGAAQQADKLIASARAKLEHGQADFTCLEGDVRLTAELGRYYGKKILAATSLARVLIASDLTAREEAVRLLTECAGHWRRIVDLGAEQYPTKTWADQLPQVQADIDYARTVQPLPYRTTVWHVGLVDLIDPGFRVDAPRYGLESRTLIEEGEGRGLGEWLERMNARLALVRVRLQPNRSWRLTRQFVAERDGPAEFTLTARASGSVRVNGESLGSFQPREGGVRLFNGHLKSGANDITVSVTPFGPGGGRGTVAIGLEVSLLPVSQITARIECEKATEITRPMVVVKDAACSGGACVEVPRDAGRGDGASGKPIDHGRMVVPFHVDSAGKYDVWARVCWPDTAANSYFIQVDDSSIVQFGQDELFGRWHWVRARDTYTLAPGVHRLILRTRETDTRGDCVVVAPAP